MNWYNFCLHMGFSQPQRPKSQLSHEERRDAGHNLLEASKIGDKDAAQMALDAGANNPDMAMAYAAVNGHAEIVQMMLDNRASDYSTAMLSAAENGHAEIVQMMINEAKKNNRYINYDSAISNADRNGHEDIVKMIQQQMT